MPRVVGIDPGTVSIDAFGLADGAPAFEGTWPTREALADPARFAALLAAAGPWDLVAGPSGYGLPLVSAAQATDEDLRLAFLAVPGDGGGIGGLSAFTRELGRAGLPVVYTPGVIHLPTVPEHRKVNRVDLGTADKVCAAALAVHDQDRRLRCGPAGTSFILLELGGAFTAAVAVDNGRIVDGLGGTSGPIGWRSAGAWDGEVAYLAGNVTKAMLFRGGASDRGADPTTTLLDAYIEGLEKAVGALGAAVPEPREIFLSGRRADDKRVFERARQALSRIAEVRRLEGFSARTKAGAQGAAILADGLSGGRHRELVETLGVSAAGGTVLDHLRVITPAEARNRLRLP